MLSREMISLSSGINTMSFHLLVYVSPYVGAYQHPYFEEGNHAWNSHCSKRN